MNSTDRATIKVVVAYALQAHQREVPVELGPDATVETAIRSSGLLQEFPQIDLKHDKIGIYGVIRALSDPIYDGARIEIYRPLKVDPKESRRRRSRASKSGQVGGKALT